MFAAELGGGQNGRPTMVPGEPAQIERKALQLNRLNIFQARLEFARRLDLSSARGRGPERSLLP
jgi:hypothetical protein